MTFFYHPCGDIKTVPNIGDTVDNSCKAGYTLCMYDIKDNKTVILGTQDNMEFRMYKDVMRVDFTNQATTASIALMCTEKGRSSVLYAPLEKIDEDRVVRNPVNCFMSTNCLFVVLDAVQQVCLRISNCDLINSNSFSSQLNLQQPTTTNNNKPCISLFLVKNVLHETAVINVK